MISLMSYCSFLSTSSEAVYKVFNTSECEYSRETCNPETFNSTNVSLVCPDAECLFAFYGGETFYHRNLILFQFYNLFLFYWCVNFVVALGHVTLAGAFASYYWAFKKPDDIPPSPVCSSLRRALRYHTGSLAFGSLILAVIQVIRVTLEYLEQRLKGAENRFAAFLLSCMKCCFWCLEKCIRFINRNAYIMVAVYGKNFCTSARDAFFLLMRNVVRVAVLDKVTDFLLFLGKLLIVGIVGIGSFFFFSGKLMVVEKGALNYYWVPILTVMLGAYLIAHGFFSVYAMCVDTLFLCFCEDLERNDGSPERPFFMSPELRDILFISKSSEEAEEEAALQENGEIPLQQQEVLTQDNEEEAPFTQEAQLTQEVTLKQEAQLSQETLPSHREPMMMQETPTAPEPVLKREAAVTKKKAPDPVDVETKSPEKQETNISVALQNGLSRHDPTQTEDQEPQQQHPQEPVEPEPQENGPHESETPPTPQNE